jgi:inner membrane protein
MDSLTHILTGALAGQLCSDKKDKLLPLIWGAIAGSIPDIDAVFQPFISQENSMLFHRGITHSLLLWALCSPLLALWINKLYKGDRRTYFKWLKISVTAWFSHLFLDIFNTYGTGIFEPFSHVRIAYDAVNVLDLMMLTPVLIIMIMIVFVIKDYLKKIVMALSAVTYMLIYIIIAISVKMNIEVAADKQLSQKDIFLTRIISSPLPLSIFAWKVVAETHDGYYAGELYGFWKNDQINFTYIQRKKELEIRYAHYDSFQKLKQFTKNWYVVEQIDGQTVMHDLRFSTLEPKKNAISFPLHLKENSLEIGHASLNRRISFKNIKELCDKLKIEN